MDSIKKALAQIDRAIAAGPFEATWESLEDYQIPRWYKDAKFGIFIHWGAYSVPAFKTEWYPRNMYLGDSEEYRHHIEKYGLQSKFGYKDFIPQFKAEKFDPGQWADVFEKSGAKFVVPVAEHHDGFAMYDCGFSEWTASKMGPKRDVIGELAKAVRKKGMVFGLSSHRAEHWWFFHEGTKYGSDVNDPRWQGLYGPAKPKDTQPDKAFLDDWLARTCELVDKYEPQIVWFDWWIEEPAFIPYLKKLGAYYYNRAAEWGRGVAINYKHQAFAEGTAVFDIERGQLSGIRPLLWQTDTSITKNSWGYITHHNYKKATTVIGDLVDIVSKNGVLLLNTGPRADGTLTEPAMDVFLEIGRWLKVNGEAIYGTRPWRVFGEGPTQVAEGAFTDTKRGDFTSEDIRFTSRGGHLYAILLGWPESGQVKIKTLAANSKNAPLEIASVELLGAKGRLKWTRDAEGLTVTLPKTKPCDHAYALKVASR